MDKNVPTVGQVQCVKVQKLSIIFGWGLILAPYTVDIKYSLVFFLIS